MLWPLQRRRERLKLVIQARLEIILKQNENSVDDAISDVLDIGFWLREVLDKNIPISDIAEYIVGLLFAAHKNPALGAAQSYLFLQEYGSERIRAKCEEEAAILVSKKMSIKWSEFKSSIPTLRRSCLESLRLTAHSIGGLRTAQKDLTVLIKSGFERDANTKSKVIKIPKGSSVGFAHITSSLDTSIWGKDAATFDSSLSRYAEETYADDYKFTTFSHGIHKCPGRDLSMIHLTMTVAFLLKEYEVKLPEKIPPLDFERATLAQREGAVMVSITRRQHP